MQNDGYNIIELQLLMHWCIKVGLIFISLPPYHILSQEHSATLSYNAATVWKKAAHTRLAVTLHNDKCITYNINQHKISMVSAPHFQLYNANIEGK